MKEVLTDSGDEFIAKGHLPTGDKLNKGLGIVSRLEHMGGTSSLQREQQG